MTFAVCEYGILSKIATEKQIYNKIHHDISDKLHLERMIDQGNSAEIESCSRVSGNVQAYVSTVNSNRCGPEYRHHSARNGDGFT